MHVEPTILYVSRFHGHLHLHHLLLFLFSYCIIQMKKYILIYVILESGPEDYVIPEQPKLYLQGGSESLLFLSMVSGHCSVVLDQHCKLFELILKYIGSVESHNINDLVVILKRFWDWWYILWMDEIIIALYDIASTRSLKIYIRRGYLIFVVGLTYHVSPIGVWIPHVL